MKIYLPDDADGNVIPSNVKVMYEKDGNVIRVDDMTYFIVSKKWRVHSGSSLFNPSKLYLNKPDSLKQLAKDLDRVVNFKPNCGFSIPACAYANHSGQFCDGCKFHGSSVCSMSAFKDVAVRVHRLCGDSE